MGYTISLHCGAAASMDHNRRTPRAIRRQEHIDPSGEYEIWQDERLRDAYKTLFGEAVADYNARVRRDRRIPDYLRSVCEDQRRHPVYETIIAIGSRDQAPDPAVGKEILRAYVDGWRDRNPRLALIGAYYHGDEEGVPHVHLDFIPWADGYQRGPARQVALDRALRQQGIASEGKSHTAQIAWQDRERSVLTDLCRSKGLDIYRLDEHRAHMDTTAYKAQEAAREAEARLGLAQDAEGRLQAVQETPRAAKIPLRDAYVVAGDALQLLQGQAAYRAAEQAVLAEAQRIRAREDQIIRSAKAHAEEIVAEARVQAKEILGKARVQSMDAELARAKDKADLARYRCLEARYPDVFRRLREDSARSRGHSRQSHIDRLK